MSDEPATRDCGCGFDGERRCCIDGAVYGPCEHEYCGGVCELEGGCDCACHKPAGVLTHLLTTSTEEDATDG